MKTVQLTESGKPLQSQDAPVPAVGPDDVLIRVQAAGICHSDAHYRAGVSKVNPLPMTLGHEIAGIVEKTGNNIAHLSVGSRVCVHYLATCGHCHFCNGGTEQFCPSCQMIGKHRDGGYAEFVCVPARSVFLLPDEIPFEQGAILMCSSATSFHALNKTRLKPGESVAIFGFGGLGFSALQLAKALGAGDVYALEVAPAKLNLAAQFGAIPIDVRQASAAEQIRQATKGKGVDIAIELVGRPETMAAAVRCLGIFGRAAMIGLTRQSFPLAPYENIINKEAEIIGISDHLASELPRLLEFARSGQLRFPPGIIRTIPLDTNAINQTLDSLEKSTGQIRTVIKP